MHKLLYKFGMVWFQESHDNDVSKLGENWLPTILNDFFLAGSETTATTLYWALLWMALEPQVQKKVQEEIDQVFGSEPHTFTLSDREKLPYVEATIMEVQRRTPIVPVVPNHATLQDVQINGYTLPKGTQVGSSYKG